MQAGDLQPQSQSKEIVDRSREAHVEISSKKKLASVGISEWRNTDARPTFVMVLGKLERAHVCCSKLQRQGLVSRTAGGLYGFEPCVRGLAPTSDCYLWGPFRQTPLYFNSISTPTFDIAQSSISCGYPQVFQFSSSEASVAFQQRMLGEQPV